MNDMICGTCVDDMDKLFDGCTHDGCKDWLCMNNSEETSEHDMIKPRTIAAPSPPSRQEAQEHSITHIPYRYWCPYCVKGKAKASPHRKGPAGEQPTVPTVAVDHRFPSEHDIDKTLDKHEHPVNCVNVLVARDDRSRCYGVIAVPQKKDWIPKSTQQEDAGAFLTFWAIND